MATLQQARVAARFAAGLYQQRAAAVYRAYVERDELAQLWVAAGRRDPYAVYERLRAKGPLNPTALGNWSSVSHEVCGQVLRDRRFGVRPTGADPAGNVMDLSFLEMDPPDHTRLRRLVAPAFSPKQLAAWRPRVEKRTAELLDGLGPSFDLVDAFAEPLPIVVISDLLGVPHERGEDFARHGATIGGAIDGIRSLGQASALMRANAELEQIFDELFALRRNEPADDVVSMVLAAEGDQVRPGELLPLCVLLLVAGFETTVNLISNTVLALMLHREQWEAVVADPTLAEAAVEETLRWDPPVQQTGRFAHEDLELAGRFVCKDQFVATLLGGANRDPDAHPDPARFDIFRKQHENLAFSSGLHHCVGRPLARLEATIAVRELAQRFPRLRQSGRIVRRRGMTIRGARHLPVSR